MNRNQLEHWLKRIEKNHSKQIKLGLERIRQAVHQCQLLPVNSFVITVGGTNGKGSTVAMIESILANSGYKVGAYSSPHLFHFNERIRINKENVSNEKLCKAFKFVETQCKNIPLSYFEFITCAAFYIFKQSNLDFYILEIGLGGRFDAVNIIDPDIAVITTIGLDHCDLLGKTRSLIAKEKAGILRQGKHFVCGEIDPPNDLIEIAENKNLQSSFIGKQFLYEKKEDHWRWWNKKIKLENLPHPKVYIQNAATALEVIFSLPANFTISNKAIIDSLRITELPARFQLVRENGTEIIYDVAHNPSAAKLLASQIKELPKAKRTVGVFAMLEDKDIVGTAKPLKPIIDTWYIAGLNVSRGASSEKIQTSLQQIGITHLISNENLHTAYQKALESSTPGDRIIVFGSFYTISNILLD